MVRPNFIPRTLIGAGGVRLFNIPGVIYPAEMLKTESVKAVKEKQCNNCAPSWGITTKQAAEMLGSTPSATRMMLHRNKVEYCVVHGNNAKRFYWRKSEVQQLADGMLPKVESKSRKLISSDEAATILGISRTSLQRYAARGILKVILVRLAQPDGGTRRRAFYERAAVLKLSYRMAAMRRHAENLDRFLTECAIRNRNRRK